MSDINHFDSNNINWDKVDQLVPAIIQHENTREVLMLGYMNQEALQQTLTNKTVTFYSRSKQRLWQKGETSGHYLKLKSITLDCDQDTLLILAKPQGPTCHLGNNSCFADIPESPWQFIQQLQQLLQQRQQQPQANSYTSELFAAGINRIAQKVGEEGVETAIAAVAEDSETLTSESADLLFHLLTLLTAKSQTIEHVITVLQQRHKDKRV